MRRWRGGGIRGLGRKTVGGCGGRGTGIEVETYIAPKSEIDIRGPYGLFSRSEIRSM